MAYEVPGFRPGTLKAGADLSSKQFYAVKLDGSGDVVVCGDGELALGLLVGTPEEGQGVEFEAGVGIAKGSAGAAFSIGDELASDASGQLVLATTGERVVGVALEAATAQNEIVSVLVNPGTIAA